MTYLIGCISGGLAGLTLTWFITKFTKDDKNSKWSKGEMWFFIIAGILVLAFLVGPFLSWRYSIRYSHDRADALWNYVFVTNIPALFILLVGIMANKLHWRSYLIFGLGFIFSLGWLLPILHNLLNN